MARSRRRPIADVAISLSALLVAATPALAQAPISCNETIVASIDVPGEIDTYTFFAEAGETPAIFLGTTGGNGALRFELLAPDGSPLAESPRVHHTGPLAEAGTYTLGVWDAVSATGGYELTVVATRLGGEQCAAFPPLRCGGTVSGTLEYAEWDFYSFTARGAERLHLAGTRRPYVVRPDGEELSRYAPDFPDSFEVAVPGTHSVGLQGPGVAGEVAPYHLTFETLSGSFNGGANAPPTPICGMVADGTRVIGCGQTKSGAIDVPGDRDLYTFFAETGDQMRVQVSPSSIPPFWAFARVFGEGNASVYPYHTHDWTVTIPRNGAYSLEISAGNSWDVGAYSVTMIRTPCASGCTSADDLSERPECSDGRDNDGDGPGDFAGRDPGCATWTSPSEDPACDDGADNDRDGGIDADGGGSGVPDEFCAGTPTQAFEHAGAFFSCGLGPELALLLPFLRALRRRAR